MIPFRSSFLAALLLLIVSSSSSAQFSELIASPDSITAGRTTTLDLFGWDHYIDIDTFYGNQLIVFFRFDDPYIQQKHSDIFSQGPIHLLDGRSLNLDVTVPDTVDQGLYEVALSFTDKTGGYSYAAGQALYVVRSPASEVVTQPIQADQSSIRVTNENDGSVLIRFNLIHPTHTTLTILDALGRQMFRQGEGQLDAGPNSLKWAHPPVSTGTYFYELTTEEGDVFGKISILP